MKDSNNVELEFLIADRPCDDYILAATEVDCESVMREAWKPSQAAPCVLVLQVLATDGTSGIEYEYWLPPDQYALYHGRRSPLRQAPHTASYLPWDQPTTTTPTTTTTTTWPPPVTTRPHWCKICSPQNRTLSLIVLYKNEAAVIQVLVCSGLGRYRLTFNFRGN